MDGVGLTPKGSTSADVSSDVSRDSTIRSSAADNQEKSSGRASGDVVLRTDSGDVLTITKDTAGKASFRNYVRKANGRLQGDLVKNGWYYRRGGKISMGNVIGQRFLLLTERMVLLYTISVK